MYASESPVVISGLQQWSGVSATAPGVYAIERETPGALHVGLPLLVGCAFVSVPFWILGGSDSFAARLLLALVFAAASLFCFYCAWFAWRKSRQGGYPRLILLGSPPAWGSVLRLKLEYEPFAAIMSSLSARVVIAVDENSDNRAVRKFDRVLLPAASARNRPVKSTQGRGPLEVEFELPLPSRFDLDEAVRRSNATLDAITPIRTWRVFIALYQSLGPLWVGYFDFVLNSHDWGAWTDNAAP